MTMTSERWARMDELFHQALGLSASDQADLLAAACTDDAALRADVEALLLAHHTDVPLLDHGPAMLMSVLETEADPRS